MYDLIIIGSGPAGLTAAIYAIRASLKTLVLAGYKWGGQLMLTSTVENFPGFPDGIQGPDLMTNMRKQAENLGVEFVDKDVVEIDVSKRPFEVYTKLPAQVDNFSSLQTSADGGLSLVLERDCGEDSEKLQPSPVDYFQARSVIIATGADTKWLDVPGEKELIGRGISSCAPCDGFFFKNKNVIVVGGGDSAMEEAHVLSKVASSVTIVYRGEKFRASKIMQDRVFANPKIKVVWNTVITEVIGTEKVTGVKLKTENKEQSSYSSSEARSQKDSSHPAQRDSNNNIKEWEMPIDGVFVAIGHMPNTMIFNGKIELDEKGFVKRKEVFENNLLKYWSTTNIEGVFVAGDVSDYKYMQGVTAAGFGCMAALDAQRWLEGNSV